MPSPSSGSVVVSTGAVGPISAPAASIDELDADEKVVGIVTRGGRPAAAELEKGELPLYDGRCAAGATRSDAGMCDGPGTGAKPVPGEDETADAGEACIVAVAEGGRGGGSEVWVSAGVCVMGGGIEAGWWTCGRGGGRKAGGRGEGSRAVEPLSAERLFSPLLRLNRSSSSAILLSAASKFLHRVWS